MPRPVMFDCISAGQGREQIEKEFTAKESWIRMNRNGIWNMAMGPIQGRIQAICENRTELLRKLMDSKDEYFRYCKATPPEKCENDTFVLRVGPDPCDECACDPTIPQRTPPESVTALIYQGVAKEGEGRARYLKVRYDSGLPETKFCYPPTTNGEYAWKLQESVRNRGCDSRPRISSIGPAFYRSRGVMCRADYAPYHFPRTYY